MQEAEAAVHKAALKRRQLHHQQVDVVRREVPRVRVARKVHVLPRTVQADRFGKATFPASREHARIQQ